MNEYTVKTMVEENIEQATPGIDRLLNISILENPGLVSNRTWREHRADRTLYKQNEKMVFQVRDSGFVYGRNSYLKFELKLGNRVGSDPLIEATLDSDLAIAQNLNTSYDLQGLTNGVGNSAAGALFRRIIMSIGAFNVFDEDFVGPRIDKQSKFECDLDTGITAMMAEGFFEGTPFFTTEDLVTGVFSRFSSPQPAGNLNLYDRTVVIPLYKLAGFFGTDRLIPLDFFKEAFRLEIILNNNINSIIRRAGGVTNNEAFDIVDPMLFLDVYELSPDLMSQVMEKEKTDGLIIPYSSHIGRRFQNGSGAATGQQKFFMPFNDSVERAMTISSTPIGTLTSDDITEDFLATADKLLIEYQVRVNKKRLPSNGPVNRESFMFSHTIKSLSRFQDCSFGPLPNFFQSQRLGNQYYITDLTRGEFGMDGSNGIILRPGDLEIEVSQNNAAADPITWFVYLEHQKVLKFKNGSLMDAE